MHYDDAYDIADMRPWRIEVNGAVLEPKDKTMPSPLQYAYKKRVYSKNRVPYPLIRVDWDPNGDRHPETRGISKYRRISWDEATDIIASELKRIHKEYGPARRARRRWTAMASPRSSTLRTAAPASCST